MVARKFVVDYDHSNFDVDYDTADGLEVFKFQLFSLTSVPPDEQKICGVDDERIVSEDSDLISISDKLRLVSITEQTKLDAEIAKADEELARMLQAEEEALMFQQFTAAEDNGVMEQRLRPYVAQVLMYEDPHRQEAARRTVHLEKLEEKALVALAKEGNFKPSKNEHDHALLLQLLYWFKQSFRWVNSPPCDGCCSETINQGMGTVNPLEITHGASRVELHRCKVCSRITRFPRYNDPLKLLETRKGRCGEWANCFTLYCRAFGYESRLIMDFTDHVWTECYSVLLGRWMHLDPCEGIYDNPLLYEKGWKKNLNYVIALSKDGVRDVTKRYTRKWHEVLTRRNITSEAALSNVLFNLTRECRKNLPSPLVSTLEERDHKEAEELETYLHSKGDTSISLPGRLSGDKEWRISRSETDSDKDNSSLSSSICPIRKCVDDHVTRIYNAFHPVISRLVDLSSFQSKHVEVLHLFRKILVDLKNSPFRERRTSIDSLNSKEAKIFIEEMLPSFNQMFDALSLKSELNSNGKVVICSSGDPVKTSLAMPVVFHALDDVIHNINQCDNFSKSSLTWPLLKLNRICSGLVLASGEELPFGIVSNLRLRLHLMELAHQSGKNQMVQEVHIGVDGLRQLCREEFRAFLAQGCWIIYKIVDEQVHELASYELMSANDAPERDPMDWVLEGSNDGGSSWHALDKQTSQIFESRFQRKTYRITAEPFPSNAFRLRILAVRDVQATSRFQIGNIDLYARKNVLVD